MDGQGPSKARLHNGPVEAALGRDRYIVGGPCSGLFHSTPELIGQTVKLLVEGLRAARLIFLEGV